MTTMLGEADSDLCAFIASKLVGGCTPAALAAEVAIVFDRDTQSFVQQLWTEMLFQALLAVEPSE